MPILYPPFPPTSLVYLQEPVKLVNRVPRPSLHPFLILHRHKPRRPVLHNDKDLEDSCEYLGNIELILSHGLFASHQMTQCLPQDSHPTHTIRFSSCYLVESITLFAALRTIPSCYTSGHRPQPSLLSVSVFPIARLSPFLPVLPLLSPLCHTGRSGGFQAPTSAHLTIWGLPPWVFFFVERAVSVFPQRVTRVRQFIGRDGTRNTT